MKSDLYSLQYEYIVKDGAVLVISSDPPITYPQLAEHEIAMVRSVTVPRLLTPDTVEMDGEITLYYAVGTRRLLTHALQAESAGIRELFAVLLNIAVVLADCKKYMLDENRVVLDETFIFAANDPGDLTLVYLPLAVVADKPDFREELEMLVQCWGKKFRCSNEAGMTRMLEVLQPDRFSLTAFRQLLAELLNCHALPAACESSYHAERSDKNELADYPDQFGIRNDLQTGKAIHEKSWVAQEMTPQGLLSHEPAMNTSGEITIDQPIRKAAQPWSLCAAALVLLAAVWVYYFAAPSDIRMNCALGLSGVEVVLAYLLAKKTLGQTHDATCSDDELQRHHSMMLTSGKEPLPFQPYLEDRDAGTTLLCRPSPTVLLKPEDLQAMLKPTAAQYAIEFEDNGGKQSVDLTGDSLIVGRDPGCQLVIDQIGVSRSHLEFVKLDEGYGVKDLNSINGSSLNDEPLVPYRTYPLNPGDAIKVIASILIYTAKA